MPGCGTSFYNYPGHKQRARNLVREWRLYASFFGKPVARICVQESTELWAGPIYTPPDSAVAQNVRPVETRQDELGTATNDWCPDKTNICSRDYLRLKTIRRRTNVDTCKIYGWRVQTCAELYMSRTPEWFISGPCAGLHTPSVRVAHTWKSYERATYGLRESNFTILTCNCCTDSARSTCVPRTVLASSVLTPHFPVDLLNDHAEHACTIPVYKDNLTGDCQLVSNMPRKSQTKTTRQDPKKRAAEDTRAASDDEVNRRCTHLQSASTACTRQRSNRTEIVRCKHVQLTYHLRNVQCTQPLTARRVVQTTYVHLAQPCE
ncbi:hypothetical protein Bbelb_024810 [Branchiostoma belcheri]|nr:hypothetical protein Bbelb_024810 [Branchiostoma belcheri]